MIYLEYHRNDGAATALEVPLKPDETWEQGFARMGPVLVRAMGLEPAPEIDPRQWAQILKTAGVTK